MTIYLAPQFTSCDLGQVTNLPEPQVQHLQSEPYRD